MKVLLPIEVPDGKYCFTRQSCCCSYFDRAVYNGPCINFAFDKNPTDDIGYLKPKKCLELQKQNIYSKTCEYCARLIDRCRC